MFTDFLKHLETQDRTPITIRGYANDLNAFARWFTQTNGAEPAPERVTPTDLREYRQWMQAVRNYKANTINRRLSAVRVWLDWAEKQGRIEFNPAGDLRGVRRQGQTIQWLGKREETALLRGAEQAVQLAALRGESNLRRATRNLAIVTLMLNTGLRVREVADLRLGDVTLSERKGSLVVTGKRNKERVIPLNANARKALQAWLEVRGEVPADTLFINNNNERLTPSGIWRIIARLSQQAGVEVHPHTLRHTFAKRLVDSGVTLEKVAALLGHSSLNTTRVYLSPGRKDLEDAVKYLEF